MAQSYFTTPTVKDRPPYLPDSSPQQVGLWQHFANRRRGVNVFLLADGTYVVDTADGVTTNTNIPYPLNFDDPFAPYVHVQNWDGSVTDIAHSNPAVKVYLGGSANPITAAEVSALTAAGYGSYIT